MTYGRSPQNGSGRIANNCPECGAPLLMPEGQRVSCSIKGCKLYIHKHDNGGAGQDRQRSGWSVAVKTKVIGENGAVIEFASKREARRYGELILRQRAGEIRELRWHTTTPLIFGGRPFVLKSKRFHKNGRKLSYTDDFRYEELQPDGSWELVVEDTKGYDLDRDRYRRAIFEWVTGIQVRVVR